MMAKMKPPRKPGEQMMPGIFAIIALFGFFAVLFAMMLLPISDSAQQPLNLLLGMLGTIISGIGNYYFGSSAGSAAKNAMLERLAAKPDTKPDGDA